MSRQNKVNPDHYTQRGRLTPDDAAREIARQRSIGSRHMWQPVKRSAPPGPPFKNESADRNAETSKESESPAASPSRGKARPAERMTRGTGTKTAAPTRAKQPKPARARTVRNTTGKVKTARAAKPAGRTTATGTARKAVLARNVGGPALKPLRAGKRRKS